MTEKRPPHNLISIARLSPPEFISGGLGVGALLRFGAARCAIAPNMPSGGVFDLNQLGALDTAVQRC